MLYWQFVNTLVRAFSREKSCDRRDLRGEEVSTDDSDKTTKRVPKWPVQWVVKHVERNVKRIKQRTPRITHDQWKCVNAVRKPTRCLNYLYF